MKAAFASRPIDRGSRRHAGNVRHNRREADNGIVQLLGSGLFGDKGGRAGFLHGFDERR